MNECIFCKIARGEIPSLVLYSDELVMAVMDIRPATLGQTIVFPKKHYQSIVEMPPEEVAYLYKVVRGIIRALSAVLDTSSFHIISSVGPEAGQRIPHYSVFIIPRKNPDTNVEKVVVYWVPNQELTQEIEKIYEKIGPALKQVIEQEIKSTAVIKEEPKKEIKEDKIKSKDENVIYVKKLIKMLKKGKL